MKPVGKPLLVGIKPSKNGKAARRAEWAGGSFREVQSPMKTWRMYETIRNVNEKWDVNFLNYWHILSQNGNKEKTLYVLWQRRYRFHSLESSQKSWENAKLTVREESEQPLKVAVTKIEPMSQQMRRKQQFQLMQKTVHLGNVQKEQEALRTGRNVINWHFWSSPLHCRNPSSAV